MNNSAAEAETQKVLSKDNKTVDTLEDISAIFIPLLKKELGEDYNQVPFTPPTIFKSRDDAFYIQSNDHLELRLLQIAHAMIETDTENHRAIEFLKWAIDTQRPESIILLRELLINKSPYALDDQGKPQEANFEFFCFLDKMIFCLNGYPDLQDLYRFERLHITVEMMSMGFINFANNEKATALFLKEIAELEAAPNLSIKNKELLKTAKILVYFTAGNSEKVVEHIDDYLDYFKEITENSDKKLYSTRAASLILSSKLDWSKKEEICKKILDALFPDKENMMFCLGTAILANISGEHGLALSIFETLGDEKFAHPGLYADLLYWCRKYEKLNQEALRIYEALEGAWIDNFLYALEVAAHETGDFESYNLILEREEERFEEDCLIEEKYRKSLPQYFSAENQTEISIVGITIDLKYSDSEGVKICELNTLTSSGLDGYKAAYQRDLRDDLRVFYEREAPFLPSDLDLIDRFSGKSLGISGSYKTGLAEQLNGLRIKNNATPSLNVRAGFKDITMLDAQDFGFDDVFPQGVVLPKNDFKRELKAFVAKLAPTDFVVLKPVNSSIGEGVTVLSKKDILKTCERLFKKRSFISADEEVWQNDIQPNFVIQKCAKSDPVLVRDGKEYDGTMRYVVSMIVHHKTGEVTVHPHGAYWKLPPKPLSDVTAPHELRETIVSQPPSKLSAEGKKQPFSEKVDTTTFERVTMHLERFLKSYAPILAQSPEDFVAEMKRIISSPDTTEARRATTINVATNSDAGYVLEAYFRNRRKKDYKDLVETIERFARTAKKNSPSGDFARAVMGIPKNEREGFVAEARQMLKIIVPSIPLKATTPDEKRMLSLQQSRNSYVRKRQRQNSSLLSHKISLFITQRLIP